ncbi:hypothetical protein [Rhodospira trueperi]|uniref:Integrase DNA-binding domain-containing protein n=1 Tax=Rhodospira trueperi TaxID=69960 RepID=A0A1G7BMM2_9PROT|nr:hypothetical protein [Rhodospira trueperi]SDE28344.1 hypothetical protein SAMN05421720_105102 [Rhodospira trueperi]
MARRLLTEEFIDSLEPPEKGEIWIADTRIRGFGVRLWASGHSGGKAYCVRTTDTNGRSVRKTYAPWDGAFGTWFMRSLNLGDVRVNENGAFPLSAFLKDAREWAEVEIARLKGRLPSLEEQKQLDEERQRVRDEGRARIEALSLRSLVEEVLDPNRSHGWSEAYRDRLRHAFNQFDPTDEIRSRCIRELLDDASSNDKIPPSISSGNFRLLKSFFNAMDTYSFGIGGPHVGRILLSRLKYNEQRREKAKDFVDELEIEDVERLLKALPGLDVDWRAARCIEACFQFRAPVSRVMGGRWSEIVDGYWVPYSPAERKNWHFYLERIDQQAFECLKAARQNALDEGVQSMFWFPNKENPEVPINNIDRAWNKLLSVVGWPRVSLSNAAKTYKQRYSFLEWPDPEKNEVIRKEILTWNSVLMYKKRGG